MMFLEREPTLEEKLDNTEVKTIIEINPLKMGRIDIVWVIRFLLWIVLPFSLFTSAPLIFYPGIKIETIAIVFGLSFIFWMFIGLGLPMPHEYILLRKQGKSTWDFENS